MLNARPHYRPRLLISPAVGYGQPTPSVNLLWKLNWPYKISTIIAGLLILFALALIALEIAFVVEMGEVNTGNVFTSGVGIWSGFFILVAGIFILFIDCVNAVRLFTLVSFGLVILATCFAIIAFSINAYRVHLSVQYSLFSSSGSPVPSLAATELAVGVVAFLFCLVFIGIYIFTAIRISRKSKVQKNIYPIQ
ncbi:unnamed protein product [Rotaria socialis]|uniref:MARVEL domain-containing protein n=1 Tax=Rotaria socialis TaxID=392032 RepID=A0A821TB56_9BILA|nr:unnamed protein product [Rotaria socialis]CAF3384049.1 unnamed protein product [Rotaria socialis]CAF3443014.1 unnamed protein product [Rotaria socialis]CAF3482747.1 unnamed protein product [Rotaria socialis]CAF3593760.1 unnamed protein product [Rotaria socialis]